MLLLPSLLPHLHLGSSLSSVPQACGRWGSNSPLALSSFSAPFQLCLLYYSPDPIFLSHLHSHQLLQICLCHPLTHRGPPTLQGPSQQPWARWLSSWGRLPLGQVPTLLRVASAPRAAFIVQYPHLSITWSSQGCLWPVLKRGYF